MLRRPLLTLATARSFLVFTVFLLCLALVFASKRSLRGQAEPRARGHRE